MTWNFRVTPENIEEVRKLREERMKDWNDTVNSTPLEDMKKLHELTMENPCREIPIDEEYLHPERDKKSTLGNELFERIKQIGRDKFKDAPAVNFRLATDEEVSDGELLDAFFTFTSNLDVASPVLPVATEIFERYMLKIEMQVTPKGIDREWFNEDEWSDELTDFEIQDK